MNDYMHHIYIYIYIYIYVCIFIYIYINNDEIINDENIRTPHLSFFNVVLAKNTNRQM